MKHLTGRKILRFFRSMPLAVGLIVLLTLLLIPASMIPQGRALSFYTDQYPEFISSLILLTGFNHFFSTPLFLIPSALFFLNLLYCTVYRFLRELKKKKKHFGPDILHIGLLLLMAGSFITFTSREEGSVFMEVGDEIILPDGSSFTLIDFIFETYPDGRPKEWISQGKYKEKEVEIRVNHPVKMGGITLYQNSYQEVFTLLFSEPDETIFEFHEGMTIGDAVFSTIEFSKEGDWRALFLSQTGERLYFYPGNSHANLTLTNYSRSYKTGLRLVQDPGVPIIFLSFAFILPGMILIFIKKRKFT